VRGNRSNLGRRVAVLCPWRTLAIGLALVLSAAVGARADMQPVSEPGDTPDQPVKTERIVIFGDSLGDGAWAGLYRLFRGDERFEVVRHTKISSGITRYHQFNWSDEVTNVLANEHADVIVFIFGANDRMSLRAEGKRYGMWSEGWQRVYRARVDALLEKGAASGARVYWLGLPIVRDEAFDRDMQRLNAIFAERVKAKAQPPAGPAMGMTVALDRAQVGGSAPGALVRYVDTRAITSNEDGEYASHLVDPSGRKRLMRADDGVHFTMRGYEVFASPLAKAILEDRGESDAPTGGHAASTIVVDAAPNRPASEAPATALDLFFQALEAGKAAADR